MGVGVCIGRNHSVHRVCIPTVVVRCRSPRRWKVDGGIKVSADGKPRSAAKILSHPGVTVHDLEQIAEKTQNSDPTSAAHLQVDPEAVEAVQVECKYVDYLREQAADMEKYRLAVSTHLKLPEG